jgi:hypothetical protein
VANGVVVLVQIVAHEEIIAGITASEEMAAKLVGLSWDAYGRMGLQAGTMKEQTFCLLMHRCLLSPTMQRQLLTPRLLPVLLRALKYMQETTVLPMLFFGLDALVNLTLSPVAKERMECEKVVMVAMLLAAEVHSFLVGNSIKWLRLYSVFNPRSATLTRVYESEHAASSKASLTASRAPISTPRRSANS